MKWFAILGALVAGAASAGPLEGQYVVADNIHLANQAGAINRRVSIVLTLNLEPGRATLDETGTSSDHNLYADYATEDDETWANAWRGTWKRAGGGVHVKLARTKQRCTRVYKQTGAQDEARPCRTTPTQLELDCTSDRVRLGLGGKQRATREVWRCTASADLGLTPRVFVVGKSACVRMQGGKAGLSYDACP